MIKAVIFDMDGLIVDTELVHSRAIERVLKAHGKKPEFLPNGLLHIVGIAGHHTNLDFIDQYKMDISVEDLVKLRRGFFEELLQEKLTPLPGLMNLLNVLKNNNYKLALASNRIEKHIHMILDNLEITKYFDVIVGPNDERRHKPHPDIYLHTAKELGVEPNECAVLEDTDVGIAAAKDAGMKAIAVPNTYTAAHDFTKADIIIDSLDKVNLDTIASL